MKKQYISNVVPDKGATVVASPGNKFSRIHLDLADDGITLALVGAASTLSNKENRHSFTVKRTEEGITLAMVGAASAAKR